MSGLVARGLLKMLSPPYRERFGDDLLQAWRELRMSVRRERGRVQEWAYMARELTTFARLVRQSRSSRQSDGPRQSRWRQDLLMGVRLARRQQVRTLVTVLMLAGGFGAAVTAFGVADAVLWRELPFRDSDRLMAVWERPSATAPAARVTGGHFVLWRERASTFESLAAFAATGFQVDGPEGVTTVQGVRVSGHFFDTLGLSPASGRLLTSADQQEGAPRVVVLSHRYWRSRFGKQDVIGQTLRLSGQPYTIVGVLPDVWLPSWPVNPARITLDPDARQLWVPHLPEATLAQNWRAHVMGVIGRLADGQSPESASQQLMSLASAEPRDPHGGVAVPLRVQMVGQTRNALILLLATALCVWIVAALNLAALDLAAFESRQGEFRARVALGANTVTLVKQMLAEALPVVIAAGLLAAGVAHAIFTLAPGFASRLPFVTMPSLEVRALALLIALVATAAVIRTAWPVLRIRAQARLTSEGRERVTASVGVYRALIAGQATGAVALTLLASVLVQSFVAVGTRDPGFDPERVLVTDVGLPQDGYRDVGSYVQFEHRLAEAARGATWLDSWALSYDHPFEANWSNAFSLVGGPTGDGTDVRAQAELRIVSAGYPETMRLQVVDGGGFDPLTAPGDAGAVLVNEAFVRQHSAGVGRALDLSSPRAVWGDAVPTHFNIVGVVRDERFRGLEEHSAPAVYLHTRQYPQPAVSLLARHREGREPTLAELRSLVRAAEPRVSVGGLQRLTDIESEQRTTRTLTTMIVSAFASGALLLAVAGLYAMLLLTLARGRRELGIRLALGAEPRAIRRRFLIDALTPVVAGVVLGIALGAASQRVVQSLLIDLSATDPASVVGVAVIVLVTALVSAFFPARKAAAVDPAITLRD